MNQQKALGAIGAQEIADTMFRSMVPDYGYTSPYTTTNMSEPARPAFFVATSPSKTSVSYSGAQLLTSTGGVPKITAAK